MRALLLAVLLAVLPGPAAASTWVPPLGSPPVVDRRFDAPVDPYGPGHRGVDLRGTPGQVVRAAGAGRVTYAGVVAGRGVVTVSHAGGLRTTYEPVAATVRTGQAVGPGQALGTLGTGHCRYGGTCLHWGLLRGAAYLDPMSLLSPAAVRLLPLDDPALGRAGQQRPVGPVADPALSRPAPPGARPPGAPHVVLRSADTAPGVAALVLLVLGLGMLSRRPRAGPPVGPAGPAAAAVAATTSTAATAETAVATIDLGAERLRRRSG